MKFQSGAWFAAVSALAMSAHAQVQPERLSFTSEGKRIGVEVFRPSSAQVAPAILVIHGAGGVDAGNRYVGQLAAAVASAGYATFLVEYFDRTGTSYAGDVTIHTHFETWLRTLKDAVTFIAEQPQIDPARIGAFGYSLGGYLAVAHAARDERIRAVVELAGGIDAEYSRRVKRLPPTLIIHGEQDQRVPFQRATELQSFLGKIGAPAETLFFPGERHIFSPLAALSALDRSLKFFQERLR